MSSHEEMSAAAMEEEARAYERYSAEEFEALMPEIAIDAPHVIVSRAMAIAVQLKGAGARSLSNNLLKGEDEAIETYLRTPLKGNQANLVLVSDYGSGKTEMLAHAHKVFGGVDKVAYIPATPELKPSELIGKTQAMKKTSEIEGEADLVETLTGEQQAMLDEDVQVAVFDEATRGNARTLGTATNAIGSRKIERGKGDVVELKKLLMTILAFNPHEALTTTSRLPGALGARMSSGVILADESRWDAILDGMDDFEATPEKIEPVIQLPELYIARAGVQLVSLEGYDDHIKQSTKKVLYALRDNGHVQLGEAPGRVRRQIETDARARALMNGRPKIGKEDIDGAVASKMTGALVAGGLTELKLVKPIIQDALEGKYGGK